ncbi:hypothetical protein BD410DRAFT_783850 [Rickenella mellea]|uniref:Protein kinase domain-containing protein n=1 Tax=Rickenella mellea TaxID=50990 RepID=A0A4Y7QGG0_9AGAM|nr:hypothetical protein BD410DRAFT_783850 [Rickenella mellea]
MERSTVKFHGKSYKVNRVLNDRPIAIVLDVSRGKKRRIIKIFPPVLHRGLYKQGFKNELLAYRTFREQRCTVVPLLWGSTATLTVKYPEGTANVPDSCKLEGNQRAIMLEYLDGEMLEPRNATVDATTKALQYLNEIHSLGIYHGDVHNFGCRDGTPRNVMILNNGDVRWIDFEHSQKGANDDEMDEEQKVVECSIGPTGYIWQTRKRLGLTTDE